MTNFFSKMFKSNKPEPKHPFRANDTSGEVQTAMLLRGLDDPADYQWRLSLKSGDLIDVCDRSNNWRVAKIVRCTDTNLNVRFEDTGQDFDLAIHRGGAKLAKPFSLSAAPNVNQQHTNTTSQSIGQQDNELQQNQLRHQNMPSNHPNGHNNHNPHLHIHPALTSIQTSTTPLTPWQPNLVEYGIGPENIIHQPEPPMTAGRDGAMTVIPMSKDNSCCFHAIAFVCDGRKTRNGLHVMQQRLRAHELVLADPETYNEIILGAPPAEYCRKLLNLQTWGSAIELGLFSSLYECEIFSFDYSQPTVYRFGEEHGYSKRVFIVYSGSHYDALAFVEGDEKDANNTRIQEIFSTKDENALWMAQAVVEKLYCQRTKQPMSLAANDQIEWKGKGLYELKQPANNGSHANHETNGNGVANHQNGNGVPQNGIHQHDHHPKIQVQTNPRPLIHSVSITTPKSHQSGSSFSFSRSSINLLQPQPNSAPLQRELESGRFIGQVGRDGSLERLHYTSSPPIPPRPMLGTIPGSAASSTRVSPSLPHQSLETPELHGYTASPSLGVTRLQPALDPVLEDDRVVEHQTDATKVTSALENLRVRDLRGV